MPGLVEQDHRPLEVVVCPFKEIGIERNDAEGKIRRGKGVFGRKCTVQPIVAASKGREIPEYGGVAGKSSFTEQSDRTIDRLLIFRL